MKRMRIGSVPPDWCKLEFTFDVTRKLDTDQSAANSGRRGPDPPGNLYKNTMSGQTVAAAHGTAPCRGALKKRKQTATARARPEGVDHVGEAFRPDGGQHHQERNAPVDDARRTDTHSGRRHRRPDRDPPHRSDPAPQDP